MRILLIVSAAVTLAACSDSQPPTTPISHAIGSATGGAGAAKSVGPLSRPVDQLGFTKITRVIGNNAIVQAGHAGGSTAPCPDGTTVVSGGYNIVGYIATATPPWITVSADNTANAWQVAIDNEQPGANIVNIRATAYCAS